MLKKLEGGIYLEEEIPREKNPIEKNWDVKDLVEKKTWRGPEEKRRV